MAYETLTYENILQRMMNRVTINYPNLDNREGSIIFNALAPAALELAIMYAELNNVLSESFVNTATREFILIACQQIGMDVSAFEAKAGIHAGKFNVEIPIGSRWNCELYNYTVTEYIGIIDDFHVYQLRCETLGAEPNNQTGDLTPITDVGNSLTVAQLTECLVEGENETSDEDIRAAYYEHIDNTKADGNIEQYRQWCSEYDGIGNCKIFPLWNGDNTVKVSILSASNSAASETLVNEFQEYLDPGTTGMGDGVAPIGAFVTVTTATEVPINVSATIKMKNGYSDTSGIATAITDYLSTISYEKTQVAYMNIGAVVLGAEGVEAVNDLLVNGGTSDVTLGDEEIPAIGTVDWTVV